MKLKLKEVLVKTLVTVKTLKDWQALPIVEDAGYLNIPIANSWNLPSVKPYKRIMIAQPIWGAYNSTTMSTMIADVPANSRAISTMNWSVNTGGVSSSGTISAKVIFVRMS